MPYPASQQATLDADGSPAAETRRGRYLFNAGGNFGGGTAKIEMSIDGGTTWNTFGSTFTTTTAVEVPVADGGQARITLTSSTAPSLKVGWSVIQYMP